MPHLPFVMATINEVQRVARVAPVSLPHKTTAPTSVEGYSFPAGSVFHANLSYIMNDPNHFHRPEKFRPERFIKNDGRQVKKCTKRMI
jgi:cytochrome P450